MAALAAAAVVLALAARGVRWAEVWQSFMRARPELVAASAAMVVLATFLRALRWRQLFAPHHHRFAPLEAWRIVLLGQALNIAVPARLGEVARVFLASEAAGRPKMAVVPTIALEKLFDAATFLMILVATSLAMAMPPWLAHAREAFAVATLLALAVAFTSAVARDRLTALVEGLHLPRWLGGAALGTRLAPALDALHSFASARAFAAVTAQTLLVWATAALANHLALAALEIDVPPVASLFLLLVLQLGTAPPSTPGKLGVFQYLCVLGLAAFDVDRERALGFGLLMHVIAYLPPLAAGSVLLVRDLPRLRAAEVLGGR